jgi:hypothetical protein
LVKKAKFSDSSPRERTKKRIAASGRSATTTASADSQTTTVERNRRIAS